MKRALYIWAFIVLGLLIQFLVYSLLQIFAISFLLRDFEKFGFLLQWPWWNLLHYLLMVLFLILGTSIGYHQGLDWWRKIYER